MGYKMDQLESSFFISSASKLLALAAARPVHGSCIAQTQQVSAPSIVRMFTRAFKADPERYREIRERARADAVARMTGG